MAVQVASACRGNRQTLTINLTLTLTLTLTLAEWTDVVVLEQRGLPTSDDAANTSVCVSSVAMLL